MYVHLCQAFYIVSNGVHYAKKSWGDFGYSAVRLSREKLLCSAHTTQTHCFRIKTAERQYVEAFEDEIQAFRGRVKARAKEKIEAAVKEAEEVWECVCVCGFCVGGRVGERYKNSDGSEGVWGFITKGDADQLLSHPPREVL